MPANTGAPHLGRKIERIRTIKGIKQDVLAAQLGMSQGTLSKIEKSASVDDDKLKAIADAFEMSVDALKNFSEDALVNIIANTVNNHDQSASVFYSPTFNPIDKLVEVFEENRKLYERLLESERKKTEMLEKQLKGKAGK